jgi:hypothetical protein
MIHEHSTALAAIDRPSDHSGMTNPSNLLRFALAVILTASAAMAFAGLRASAADADEPASPSVADLAWMEGTWTTSFGENELEEVWSRPNRKSMMGMFRWSRGGESWMYELMTIEQEESGLIFRLRHFDAQLTPWEKEGPLTYPLLRAAANEVAFENPENDRPRRFVYRREGDVLIVRLEGAGDPDTATTFRLKRVDLAQRAGENGEAGKD